MKHIPIFYDSLRGLGRLSQRSPIPAQNSPISTPQRLTALVYGSAAQPVSQLFKIGLTIRESKLGEDLARENLRQQKQDMVHQVRQAYYDLARTQSQISGAEATLKYLTELSALMDRNLAEQTVLKSDTLNVKAKLSQRRYRLLMLHDAIDKQMEDFNRLLGQDLGARFSVEVQPLPSTYELDVAAARKTALAQRPELRKTRLQNAKAELDIRRERAEYIPNVSLQLSYLSLANVSSLLKILPARGSCFSGSPLIGSRNAITGNSCGPRRKSHAID